MGKGEIARNKQFLLFPQCFLLNQKIVSPFVNIFDIISLFAAELEDLKLAYEVKVKMRPEILLVKKVTPTPGKKFPNIIT